MADTERVVWVEMVKSEELSRILAGEGGGLPLQIGAQGNWFPKAEGWQVVSYTFVPNEDGSALLTMLVERQR